MKINVLDDKGYVLLRDTMGDDLTPVNAARVSYDKRSEELTEKDVRLIRFLIKHAHTSPFRHAVMQFEVYAPLFVARQWWKHAIGSTYETLTAWNESSRRYVTEEPEFYIPRPHQWRGTPESNKQGSEGLLIERSKETADLVTVAMENQVKESIALYEQAQIEGIAAEQARLFLPAYAMYVRFWWTTSLQSVLHFLDLRLEEGAQWEIREYAKAVLTIVKEQFPAVLEAWKESDEQ